MTDTDTRHEHREPAPGDPCTYRGCLEPPTVQIEGAAGRSWLGCDAHWPAMVTALEKGQAADVGAPVHLWPPARSRSTR
jgi:hypothetical protein